MTRMMTPAPPPASIFIPRPPSAVARLLRTSPPAAGSFSHSTPIPNPQTSPFFPEMRKRLSFVPLEKGITAKNVYPKILEKDSK
jgi:hypothetical protein